MRNELLSKVVAKFGFSDMRVVEFAERCEEIPNNFLGNALIKTEFESLMAESIFSEE